MAHSYEQGTPCSECGDSDGCLQHREIFVFGSNLAGIHGAGSAKHARKYYGAIQGVGEGRMGTSYAIPTKDAKLKSLSLAQIAGHVDKFIAYATEHPKLRFIVVAIGCGLAGYKPLDIAPMFSRAPINVALPSDFRGENL